MTLRLGQLRVSRNSKERFCRQCYSKITHNGEEFKNYSPAVIKVDEAYVSLVGFNPAKGFRFTNFLHLYCIEDYLLEAVTRWVENPKNNKHLTPSVLAGLTPEQIKRRKVLQLYITSKDKPRLVAAYESHNVDKVLNAYRIILSRWNELYDMGVPFNTSLYLNPDEEMSKRSPLEQQLQNQLSKYDSRWSTRLREETDVQKKLAMLARTEELPKFPENTVQPIIPPQDAPTVMTPEQIANNLAVETAMHTQAPRDVLAEMREYAARLEFSRHDGQEDS